MVQSTSTENNAYNVENCHVKPYFYIHGKLVCAYRIYRDNIIVGHYVWGWRSALKYAEKYAMDLFNNYHIIEIVNLNTGEVLSLEEAQKRTAKRAKA